MLNVLLKVLGSQQIDMQKDSMEMTTVATLDENESCYILHYKEAQEQGVEIIAPTDEELTLLNSDEEKELIRHLSALTDEIVTAAELYNPAKITHYVIELATLFHKFYNAHRVMIDDESLMRARLYLCTAVKDTIKNILTMLKITTPEVM